MQSAHVPDRLLVKIVLTAAVAVAGVWLSLERLEHHPHYFLVDELAATGLRPHEGVYLRVHGFVVAGSILPDTADPTTHRFMLTRNGVALRTVFHGPLPDTFKDQSEVVVSGKLTHGGGSWFIEGDEMFTKCGGKYEAASPKASSLSKFK